MRLVVLDKPIFCCWEKYPNQRLSPLLLFMTAFSAEVHSLKNLKNAIWMYSQNERSTVVENRKSKCRITKVTLKR